MNAMDSIFLPRFTIGENAFDAFHDEMGRYGKKVAVIHGERAWKAAREYVVPALEKAGLTIIRSQMIRRYRKQICSLQ